MSHGNPHQNIDTSLRITGEPWMRKASTQLLKVLPMVDVVVMLELQASWCWAS